MKALSLRIARLVYLYFPLPGVLKTRLKTALSVRIPIVERASLAARRQVEANAIPDVASPYGTAVMQHRPALPPLLSEATLARGLRLESASCRSISYVSEVASVFGESTPPVRAMAFYLPQFHPIAENDQWWGKGFTEWFNVTRARPQIEGQWQPHLPAELGFYDLRTPGVQRRQAELAAAHGIEGFCFYFYWFGGKRLLEQPIQDFAGDTQINLSFSLCWANENWTRRWDGHDEDVLIGQNHSVEDDIAFIEHVARYMKNPRYVRIGGRPLLTVYRPALLPDAAATAKRWRVRCRELGLGEIYLAFTLAFDTFEPGAIGFDGAIEFPPNNFFPPNITNRVRMINPAFNGSVYDFRAMVERSKSYGVPGHDVFRGVCPSWDNEARKSGRGSVLAHSSPRRYCEWLENAARDTIDRYSDEQKRLVFINAWNEWAEGAHLEPDARFGYAYLQATRSALLKAATPRSKSWRPQTLDVIIHAYYPELLPEILEKIISWDVPYRIYVTTVEENAEEVRKCLNKITPEAVCLTFENKGRDILPFLKLCARLFDSEDALVLKLHTKKSLHRGDGDIWRKDLLDKLTTAAQVKNIFNAFRSHENLRLVAPEGHILSMDTYWGSNAATVDYLCRRMSILPPEPELAAFPAGSMFYIRPSMLMPLLDIHLDESDFESEAGQVDGTMAHAIERIFGLLAKNQQGIFSATNEPGVDFTGHLKHYQYADAATPDILE